MDNCRLELYKQRIRSLETLIEADEGGIGTPIYKEGIEFTQELIESIKHTCERCDGKTCDV